MKYIALLRGINVGGNNKIPMAELRKLFEEAGLENVKTYINSGNIIFETQKNRLSLTNLIENMLTKTFNYDAKIVLISESQLHSVVDNIPENWKQQNDLRCYVCFVRVPATPSEVVPHIELKEGIDFLKEGENVIYMTTKLSGITKSGFTKLITKKIYQDITIRNFNTVSHLQEILTKS